MNKSNTRLVVTGRILPEFGRNLTSDLFNQIPVKLRALSTVLFFLPVCRSWLPAGVSLGGWFVDAAPAVLFHIEIGGFR